MEYCVPRLVRLSAGWDQSRIGACYFFKKNVKTLLRDHGMQLGRKSCTTSLYDLICMSPLIPEGLLSSLFIFSSAQIRVSQFHVEPHTWADVCRVIFCLLDLSDHALFGSTHRWEPAVAYNTSCMAQAGCTTIGYTALKIWSAKYLSEYWKFVG